MENESFEQTCERIVRREVGHSVSFLVSELAKGYGDANPKSVAEMTEEAFELCSPVQDWEEAALHEGFEVRHDKDGFYLCTAKEARHEDQGNPSVGFDGRDHLDSIEEAARTLCESAGFDPYEWEIYEHWIVSDWLANALREKGERVGELAGLTIWGRTTTGQGISSDRVIQEIVKAMIDR